MCVIRQAEEHVVADFFFSLFFWKCCLFVSVYIWFVVTPCVNLQIEFVLRELSFVSACFVGFLFSVYLLVKKKNQF